MKDLIALKRGINDQLASVSRLTNTHRKLVDSVEHEGMIMRSLKSSWRSGTINQATYQSYKACTTPLRNALHCQVVEIKEAIRQAKDALKAVQFEYALRLKEHKQRQKDNLFLAGKAFYERLTVPEQNALDHYMLSKSYARTN